MSHQIILASSNAGKLKELQSLLSGTGATLVRQTDLDIPDAAETGLTFVENALIKARHAAQLSGLPALADDSGLSVDALGGAPGIHSARYAGTDATDEINNHKLLQALKGLPDTERTAQFHCVIVYLRHATDPVPLICHGIWHGRIRHTPAGDNGFGYDPLFEIPELGCSSAQLAPEQKNRISHRGRALQELLRHWPDDSPSA